MRSLLQLLGLAPLELGYYNGVRGWLLLLAGSIATGTMLLLSLPLGEQWYLAFVALVPLLVTSKERGFVGGFLGGILAVFWCAWLSTTGVFYKLKFFEVAPAWTYTSCGLFAFSFSIFFALWADRKNHSRPIWWLASVAVLLECVLVLQIPAHLALTQYRNPLMMFCASVGGIWLVSYLVWFANLCIVNFPKKSGWIAVVIALSFAAQIGQSAPLTKDSSNQSGTKFAMMQVNSDNEELMVSEQKRIGAEEPKLSVWPEFGGIIFVRQDDPQRLIDLARESGVPIATSYPDTFEPLPHNVASVVSAKGESSRYEKRKLFAGEKQMHTAGVKPVAVPLPSIGKSVGLNICFDSCFPWIVGQTAALPDVQLVALPTIDPQSPHHFLAAMHAAYTPFRSAESGVAIIRADGHYGSMFINESGRIVAELKNEQQAKVFSLELKRKSTIYQTLGDWWLYLMIIALVTEPIVQVSRARRKRALQSIQDSQPRQTSESDVDIP